MITAIFAVDKSREFRMRGEALAAELLPAHPWHELDEPSFGDIVAFGDEEWRVIRASSYGETWRVTAVSRRVYSDIVEAESAALEPSI